jgi:hypothetical protein
MKTGKKMADRPKKLRDFFAIVCIDFVLECGIFAWLLG